MPGRSTDPGSPVGVFWAVFALTALPFGIIWGIINGALADGLVIGCAFGILMGFAMIPFLRVGRETLAVSEREGFERKLNIEMSELGYTPTRVEEDYLQFRAAQTGVWEYGPLKNMTGESLSRVSVHFGPYEATFVGPRWMLRKIVSRM